MENEIVMTATVRLKIIEMLDKINDARECCMNALGISQDRMGNDEEKKYAVGVDPYRCDRGDIVYEGAKAVFKKSETGKFILATYPQHQKVEWTEAHLSELNYAPTPSQPQNKEWEIVEFRAKYMGNNDVPFTLGNDGMYRTGLNGEVYGYSLDDLVKEKAATIYSVKRLSDGEVFSVGDMVCYMKETNPNWVINAFFIRHDGKLIVRSKSEMNVEMFDKDLKKVPTPSQPQNNKERIEVGNIWMPGEDNIDKVNDKFRSVYKFTLIGENPILNDEKRNKIKAAIEKILNDGRGN